MDATGLRSLTRELDEVLAFSHSRAIDRHARDHQVSTETALRRFSGLKQFMVVAATTPGKKVTSPEIDLMWHTFLLFTKDYRTFCADYLGRYVEHAPFEDAAPLAYERTRSRARDLFGSLDDGLWPVHAQADCSSGCDD